MYIKSSFLHSPRVRPVRLQSLAALPLRVTAVGKVIRITRLPLRVTVVGRSLLKNGSWLSATDKQKNKKEKEP